MLTLRRVRVLDDVRQRLLDDAVDRRLDLGSAAARRRGSPRGRRGARTARGTSRRAARPRGRARSRRGRTAAARPRAAARPAASRRRARGRTRSPPGPPRPETACSSGFSPSRIEVSAWPVSSCSSRASRLRSSSCAATTRPRTSRLTRCERLTRRRRARAEGLDEPQVVVVNAGVAPALSCTITTPIGRPARPAGRRAPSGRRAAALPAGRSPGPPAPSRRARCCPRSSTRPAFEPANSSRMPTMP